MPDSHNHSRNDSATEPVSRRVGRGLLALARQASALKRIPRTGWLDRGVPPSHVESVADHSYGVALLAGAAALEGQVQGFAIDPHRVLALALLHDLAEADTGDLTPYDPASIPEADDPELRRAFLNRRQERDSGRTAAKRAAEDAAMAEISASLPPAAKAMIAELWAELRRGESAEARFVKQADRLETFLQSLRYLESDPSLPMDSFRREVIATIDDPTLITIRDEALARRDVTDNSPPGPT